MKKNRPSSSKVPFIENRQKEEEKPNSTGGKPVMKYPGYKAFPYTVGNEAFEKLGTTGALANLVVYLNDVFHMEHIQATTALSVFQGTSNLASLVGAFLTDTYFGRYKALAFSCIASFLGMLILALTAIVPSLHPPSCSNTSTACKEPTAGQYGFLILAFAFLTLGSGGIRPNNLAFGVEQFDLNTESGRKGASSFFNYYYMTWTIAIMLSQTLIVYVQSEVSWSVGFAMPVGLMFIGCAFFFMGTKIYVIIRPEGSPLTSVAQVFVAAFRNRRLSRPENPEISCLNYLQLKPCTSKLPYTKQFRLLDKAAVITDEAQTKTDGSVVNPWKLCSIQQVEEVKCLLRVFPIWVSAIMFHIPLQQQSSYYLIYQALQSNRYIGTFRIPAGSFPAVIMLFVTIWIIVYAHVILPSMEKLRGKKGGFTTLQKMGLGLVFSILCSTIAGFVERYRKDFPFLEMDPEDNNKARGGVSSMSSLWLLPQLSLAGISEGLNNVAQTEFFYSEFPDGMKSISQSAYFVAPAVASYMVTILVNVVQRITSKGAKDSGWLAEDLNKGKLEYFYFMLAVFAAFNLVYFLVCAKWYKYRSYGDSGDDAADLEAKGKEKFDV